MKTDIKQTTTRQSKTNRSFHGLAKQEEEAKKAFMKYHPMENNSSFKVDDDYMKRFEKVFGAKAK